MGLLLALRRTLAPAASVAGTLVTVGVLTGVLAAGGVRAQAPAAPVPTLEERIRDAGSLGGAIEVSVDALEAAIASGSADSAAAVLERASHTLTAYSETPGAKTEFARVIRALDLAPLPEPGRTRFEVDVLSRSGYCGKLDEAQLGLAEILARRDDRLDAASRARAHYMMAFCAYYLGDAAASTRHARLSGESSLRGRDTLRAMEAFDGVSTSFYRLGAVDSALHYGRVALSLSRAIEDRARIQNVYLNYAEALGGAGQVDSARHYLSAASRLAEPDQWALQARLQLTSASLYRLEGRARERIRALKDAVHYFAINEEHHQATDLRDTIAHAYAAQGDYRAAFRYRDRAAAERDSLHAARLSKDTDARLAAIERDALGRERAEAAHREAMAEAVLANAQLQRVVFGVALLALSLVIALGVARMRTRKERANRLHALVEERTAELTEQAEALRASNAELERFAYIASHDLKTPLRNVTSFLGLAKRRLPPEAQEAVGEYLAIAADNARHMHALISDVLEYSRIGRAEEEAVAELSLAAVAEEVKRAMSADLVAGNASVTVDGDARALLPHTSLTQVLTNLIENGLKYNRSEAPSVRVAIVDMGDRVRVTVTDNGIGIAPEYHARVFEVFRRLHTVDEYGGTGVGLSTCLKVVRQLGGDIALASEVGCGSTFTVTLPKASSPKALTPEGGGGLRQNPKPRAAEAP